MRGAFKKALQGLFCFVVLTGFMGTGAFAMEKPDDYPKRPITIVSCYGQGGGSDQLTRAVAGPLEEIIGVPIQVVNIAGGGGMAGVAEFKNYPDDGYALLNHIDDLASNYALGRLKDNPTKDLIPLAIMQLAPSQIYIHSEDDRFNNWEEFVKYIHDNPGKITVSNVSASGSMEVLMMKQLKDACDLDIRDVTIAESSERYSSLVGRHVDAMFEQPGDVLGFIESGDIKPILTLTDFRPERFSDVPSLKDIGVEDEFNILWRFRGFWAPKNMPKERREYLEWAFGQVYNHPDFQKWQKKKGYTEDIAKHYRNTEEAIELINGTVKGYEELYEQMNIKK